MVSLFSIASRIGNRCSTILFLMKNQRKVCYRNFHEIWGALLKYEVTMQAINIFMKQLNYEVESFHIFIQFPAMASHERWKFSINIFPFKFLCTSYMIFNSHNFLKHNCLKQFLEQSETSYHFLEQESDILFQRFKA